MTTIYKYQILRHSNRCLPKRMALGDFFISQVSSMQTLPCFSSALGCVGWAPILCMHILKSCLVADITYIPDSWAHGTSLNTMGFWCIFWLQCMSFYVIYCHIIFWIFILQKFQFKSNCPCEMKSHFSYSFLTFSLGCPKNPSLTGAWFIAEDLPKPFDVKGVGKAQRIELRIATSEPIQKNIQRFCSMLRMLVVLERDTHTKRLSIETSPVPWCSLLSNSIMIH